MNFDELVKFVRDRCRVRIYSSRSSIHNGARGTFSVTDHGPVISIAAKGVPKYKKVETLLHEYGHFLQYEDGFMGYLDSICDTYEITDRWIKGVTNLTPMELQVARNTMLTLEYDAERRGCQTGIDLSPSGFCPKSYVRGANAYMDGIKWQYKRRQYIFTLPHRRSYKAELLTNSELYSELTESSLKRFDKRLNRSPSVILP